MRGPLLWGVNILKRRDFQDRQNGGPNLLKGRRHLAYTVAVGGLKRRQNAAVVDGAKRLGPAGRPGGKQRIGGGAFGGIQQPAQEIGGKTGHVAGGQQVPVGGGVPQRGDDSPERALAGVDVGDGRKTKMTIAIRIADQRGAARRQFHGARHRFRQQAAAKRQQGFIPSHSGTAASHQ